MTIVFVESAEREPEIIRVSSLSSGDFFLWGDTVYLVLSINELQIRVRTLKGEPNNFLPQTLVRYIKKLKVTYEI